MDGLLTGLGILELAAAVKGKQVSPVEVVEDYLKTIERKEPEIRAWVTVTADHALKKAKQIEQKIVRGERTGLLAGVPYAAKDIFYTAGIRTTASSRVLDDFVPDYDASAIRLLDQEDAILIGKSTTAEFACSRVTQTRNPWNTAHSPGGSSSGSGAAVAADMALFALGTQTGGSLLRPSAYCGLVSIKATLGRLSRHGVIPVSWTLDHIGPMTKTIEEQALVLHVLSGYDPKDPISLQVRKIDKDVAPLDDLKGLRIGVPTSFFYDDIEPEVKASLERAIGELRAQGADIVELELPEIFDAARAAHAVIMRSEASAYHDKMFLERFEKYGAVLQESLALGRTIPQYVYLKAQRIRNLYIQAFYDIFNKIDLVVAPTAPGVAPAGESTGDARFNSPFTMAGLPSMTVPCGIGGGGLPIGMQLAGKPLSEELLLSVGAVYERCFKPAKEE